ncbi:MAG: FecR family protein [Marinifilaceae bacterium]
MEKIDLDIIHRKLNGKTTVREEEQLKSWLAASANHRDYYRRIKLYSEKSVEELDLDLVPDTTADFMKKLDRKSRVVQLRRVLQYAAVIFLPLLVGATLWFYSNNDIRQDLADNTLVDVVEPAREQAVLITSTGKTYELETGIEQPIEEEEGVKIHKYLKAGLKYEKKAPVKGRKLVYNTLKTAKGGEYILELADGTTVYLNCDSELRYPVSFGEGERRVELKGEAFFEVTKNGQPFIVDVDDMEVEVLGTRFNVMAYKEEGSIQTTLVSGKVKVNVQEEGVTETKSVFLEPGKQASWNKETGALESREVETELYTSWIEGYFRFEDQRLEDLMRNISRWYNIKVFYQNPALKNKRLTGKLYRFSDFNVIANMLEKISGVEINKNKNAVVISVNK